MYEVFDKFLRVPTWHTRHPTDMKRFFVALREVVMDIKFNADAMASYMCSQKGVARGDGGHIAESIEQYASDAWAVSDYLKANEYVLD